MLRDRPTCASWTGSTDVPLVQLIDCTGAPYDLVAAGDPRTYADLVSPHGLRGIAATPTGSGPARTSSSPATRPALLTPTPVIADAHRRGLQVHAWTFRVENQFLPLEFRVGTDPTAVGDLRGELGPSSAPASTGSSPTTPTSPWAPCADRAAGHRRRSPCGVRPSSRPRPRPAGTRPSRPQAVAGTGRNR